MEHQIILLAKDGMGLSIKGGGSYGIHGNSDKENWKYVSLGCVRMYNQDVEILYQLIDKRYSCMDRKWNKLKEYGILFKWILDYAFKSVVLI